MTPIHNAKLASLETDLKPVVILNFHLAEWMNWFEIRVVFIFLKHNKLIIYCNNRTEQVNQPHYETLPLYLFYW